MADLSPAAELRQAAKLMRERAEAATEGPWAWEATGEKDNSWAVGLVQDEAGSTLVGRIEAGEGIVIDGVCEGIGGRLPDAEHIAGMHPGTALAVADLLDATSTCECEEDDDHADIKQAALAIARAYLAGDTP